MTRRREHQVQPKYTDIESDMENSSITNRSVLHSLLADFFADRTPWLRSQLPTPETRRHSGGFLLTTRGRDPWAAIDTARATIARFDARVKVARPTNDQIKLDGWARIAGSAREFEIHPSPRQVEIRSYVTESLRRLYNQRNTIVHAGSLRSAVLPATVRTSLSLVGAGLDRIVHTLLQTNGQLAPLSLVARAETELRLVGQVGGRDLGSLLE